MKRPGQIYKHLLKQKAFTLTDSIRVYASHNPSLRIFGRLVRGLQDDADPSRSFSVLELAVPKYRFFLTAFSEYTPSPSEWSDQFYLFSLASVRGTKRTPVTLLFHEHRRER